MTKKKNIKEVMPIKINDNISISKKDILLKYDKMDKFFLNCINALYGDEYEDDSITLNCYLPRNIINENVDNNCNALEKLIGKTGVYVFLNSNQIPVYIGIGGKDVSATQCLKERLCQQLRVFVPKNKKTKYSKSSGATLSKNIQDIEGVLQNNPNNPNSPNNSIKKIKAFSIITISVGDIANEDDVYKSRSLEMLLTSLFHPKYNK